tara:strand:+ start:788 stop:1117 length:330 start_codon:yes stop_codon:yes gene_type:complete
LEPHTVENEYSSLPTPTARDYKDTMVEVAKHRPEDTDTLNRAMAHLLPTPITQMESRKTPEFGVSLLDTLIGASTSPLLDGGSDSLDQPQIPHINEQDDNDSTQPSWSG